MVKRALPLLLIAIATLAVSSAVASIAANAAWERAGTRPWPANLGSLQDFESNYPKRDPSADALRLVELARPLGIDFTTRNAQQREPHVAIATFVHAEQERGVVAIGEPLALVAEFMTKQAAPIDAMRDHILQSREIAWAMDLDRKFDAPLPNLLAHLQVARLLATRAHLRARSNDAGAWEDLRAVSVLENHLHQRPELLSQLIALSLARTVNATAWKMPLPAPAWLADLRAVDRRRLMLRGLQHDAWLMWRHMPESSWSRAYLRASTGSMASHQRETAFGLASQTRCGFDGKAYFEQRMNALPSWNTVGRIATPNLGAVWSRTMRYEAEQEATANALRVRAGEAVETRSHCSDGSWGASDGRVAFSRTIPSVGQHEMPLALSVR